MALAALLSSASTWEDLALWSLAHAQDHDEIDLALITTGKLPAPLQVPLDPLPPADGIVNWLFRHQLKHTEMNDALGVSSSDLTSFDFSNPEEIAAFIGSNFSEHLDVHESLRI